MGDKFAGGVAERLDEEYNSLIQDYETIKEFADFLANSTPEQRQALLNKYGDAAKKLFTDSEYRGQVGDAIVEAFKEGITDDIEKFTRITSGDEKDIGYTTTHAALMAYGIWKRYGKKIGKEVVRAVDDDVAKNTVDSKTLKKAKDGGENLAFEKLNVGDEIFVKEINKKLIVNHVVIDPLTGNKIINTTTGDIINNGKVFSQGRESTFFLKDWKNRVDLHRKLISDSEYQSRLKELYKSYYEKDPYKWRASNNKWRSCKK